MKITRCLLLDWGVSNGVHLLLEVDTFLSSLLPDAFRSFLQILILLLLLLLQVLLQKSFLHLLLFLVSLILIDGFGRPSFEVELGDVDIRVPINIDVTVKQHKFSY
jgi:hypothetical protein